MKTGYPRTRWAGLQLVTGLLLMTGLAQAATRLQSIDYSQLPGARLEFVLRLDGPAVTPRDFQTENPDRIVLDFPGVNNGLDKRTLPLQRAGVKSVQAVEAGGAREWSSASMTCNLIHSEPRATGCS